MECHVIKILPIHLFHRKISENLPLILMVFTIFSTLCQIYPIKKGRLIPAFMRSALLNLVLWNATAAVLRFSFLSSVTSLSYNIYCLLFFVCCIYFPAPVKKFKCVNPGNSIRYPSHNIVFRDLHLYQKRQCPQARVSRGLSFITL